MPSPYPSAANKHTRAWLEKHPDTPNQTAAKALYKKNPEMWATLDACRQMVRRIRGNQGRKHRASVEDKSQFRPNRVPGHAFDRLPDPVEDFSSWPAIELPAGRWLCLFDVHVPFHDKTALRVALDYGLATGCDHVLLGGDFMDFYAVSRWDKDPQRCYRLGK